MNKLIITLLTCLLAAAATHAQDMRMDTYCNRIYGLSRKYALGAPALHVSDLF